MLVSSASPAHNTTVKFTPGFQSCVGRRNRRVNALASDTELKTTTANQLQNSPSYKR